MNIPQNIQNFNNLGSIAVVGVSRDSKAFANSVFRKMKESGYEVFPVNTQADLVEDQKCFHTISELPVKPDGVLSLVPDASIPDILQQCADVGVTNLWIFTGTSNATAPEIKERCKTLGIDLVNDICPMMFLDPVGFPHNFHRWIFKIRGRLN